MEVAEHVLKLWTRMTHMEKTKDSKPFFSQACDKLVSRIQVLNGLKDDSDMHGS